MLTNRLSGKRLDRQLARARALRKRGRLHQALNCYSHAMNACGKNEEKRLCCLYLMAFTHVLIDHHEHHFNYLGADFRHHHKSQLEHAYECLKLIDMDHFNPKDYGLPALTRCEIKQVMAFRHPDEAVH
jgi:hypothetical protein